MKCTRTVRQEHFVVSTCVSGRSALDRHLQPSIKSGNHGVLTEIRKLEPTEWVDVRLSGNQPLTCRLPCSSTEPRQRYRALARSDLKSLSLTMERSGIALPPRFQGGSDSRSAIAVPPRFVAAASQGRMRLLTRKPGTSSLADVSLTRVKDVTMSQSHSQQDFDTFDMVALVHLISSDLQNYQSKDFSLTWPMVSNPWNIVGQGRTFAVRRFPKSDRQEYDDQWRPSTALKTLRLSERDSPTADSLRYRSLIQELRILRHSPLNLHPNLIRITELSWEPDAISPGRFLPTLSTEYALYGSLKSFLSTWELAYPFKKRAILDVAEGLCALHQCSITHGDVKLDNVLVFPHDDEIYPFIAKIADFGFSMDTNSGPAHQYLVGRTPLWAAPEAAQQLQRSQMHLTDVYSFGFLTWSVALNGESPFEVLSALSEDVDERYDMLEALKRENGLLDVALECIRNYFADDYGEEFGEISEIMVYTLQTDPCLRSLYPVLDLLRESSHREADIGVINSLEYNPMKEVDLSKVRSNYPTFPCLIFEFSVLEGCLAAHLWRRWPSYQAKELNSSRSIFLRRYYVFHGFLPGYSVSFERHWSFLLHRHQIVGPLAHQSVSNTGDTPRNIALGQRGLHLLSAECIIADLELTSRT